MSFDAEEFFTGKKSKNSSGRSYDWMGEAIHSGSGGGSSKGGIPNIGIDLGLGGGGSSKSKKNTSADLTKVVNNLHNSAKSVHSGIKMVRDYKGNKTIQDAENIKKKEERGKKIAEAQKVIDDFKERKMEYEARKREENKQKQSVLSKLRNLGKRNNANPDHLKPQ